MPLTRAQAEDFIVKFFKDHRLVPPPIGRRHIFRITLARRKRLNLPYTITRGTLADAIAARLCREIIRRDSLFRREVEAMRHRADHRLAQIPEGSAPETVALLCRMAGVRP